MVDGKKKYIIDRTMLNSQINYEKASKDDILRMLFMIKNIGADYLEIDSDVVSSFNNLLPKDIYFIYKINNIESCEIYSIDRFSDIEIVSVDYNVFLILSKQAKCVLSNKKLIVEVDFSAIDSKDKIMLLREILNMYGIQCIRVKNIYEALYLKENDTINSLRQNLGDEIYIDICTDNRSYMATAVCLEAITHGADSITISLLGRYGANGTAATEEVLLALKYILGVELKGNTSVLKDLAMLYEDLTGETIDGMKPVVGRDIFKYESGVHADGIEKNPATYEPYDPAVVGLERKLIIGKHSGSKAIKTRLQRLGFNYNNECIIDILTVVRQKSVELKRGLEDADLIEICKRVSG